jgi:hypothetical protein
MSTATTTSGKEKAWQLGRDEMGLIFTFNNYTHPVQLAPGAVTLAIELPCAPGTFIPIACLNP